jgi:hemerythrin
MLLNEADFPRVELDFMNQVHLEEVEMLNELAELFQGLHGGKQVERLLISRLRALLEHTRQHFNQEETLMRQTHFPAYSVHKQEHERVLGEMETLFTGWENSGDSSALERYLLNTAPKWLVHHAATMDRITARYLADQGVSSPA